MTTALTPSPMSRPVSGADAHDDILAGRMVVVWTSGHCAGALLVMAAALASVPTVAAMVRHGSGLICVTITTGDAVRLNIPAMSLIEAGRCEDYRVSIDAVGGGTGISATDRARTVRAMTDGASSPTTFTRPGHVLPVLIPDQIGWSDSRGVHRSPAKVATDLVRPVSFENAVYTHLIETETGMAADEEYAADFAHTHNLTLVITEP